MEKAEGKVKRH